MVSRPSSPNSINNDDHRIYAIYWSDKFNNNIINKTNNRPWVSRKCWSRKTNKNDYSIVVYWFIFWSWILNSFQIFNNYYASLYCVFLWTFYSHVVYNNNYWYFQYVYCWTYLYVLFILNSSLLWLNFKQKCLIDVKQSSYIYVWFRILGIRKSLNFF